MNKTNWFYAVVKREAHVAMRTHERAKTQNNMNC